MEPADPNGKQETTKIKVKLSDGTNYQMISFRSGTNKSYVTHIIAIKQLLEQKEMEEEVEEAFRAVTAIKDNKLGSLYKKFNASKDIAEKVTLKVESETTKEDFQKAKKGAQAQIVKAYELVCIYFLGKAWTQWDKVVTEMHMQDLWVAVNGVSHKGPHMKTWVSFLDCIKLHKLTIFSCDAVELQHYYMQQGVKKPQSVPVRSFMARMGLLNNYLAHLPTVKDSSMAVEDTKKGNEPFNEADLAEIMLKAVLSLWVNQYNLTHLTLPKSPRLLLLDLENIKRVMNEKHAESAKARARDSAALVGTSPTAPRRGRPRAQVSESPRRFAPQSSASTARTTTGPTCPTIPRNVASTPRVGRL